MMNRKQTRMMLWGGTAVTVTAGVLTLMAAILWPWGVTAGVDEVAVHGTQDQAQDHGQPLPQLSEFAAVWNLNLQQPLVDPPPPTPPPGFKVPPPVTRPASPLSVRLVGTVLERDRSVAVLMTKDGKTHLREVGGEVEGVQVQRIANEQVSVRYHGRDIDLTIPKERKP